MEDEDTLQLVTANFIHVEPISIRWFWAAEKTAFLLLAVIQKKLPEFEVLHDFQWNF